MLCNGDPAQPNINKILFKVALADLKKTQTKFLEVNMLMTIIKSGEVRFNSS